MTVFTGLARPLVLSLTAAAMLVAGAPLLPAASNFDGEWSVIIITEAGTCDRAYRYPVKVTNGELKYEGEAAITLSGTVDARGKLSAMIRRGEQSANGSGQLSRSSGTGTGTWTGKSSTTTCAGRWEAEKRAG